MFRVVADQLKISEGWVRCGHCADVFDATLYLQPWTPPGEESAPENFVTAAPEPEAEPASTLDAELDAELEAALEADSPRPVETNDDFPEARWEDESAPAADPHAIDTLPPPAMDAAPLPPSRSDDPESDFHAELERFAAGLGRLTSDGAAAEQAEAPVADPGAMPEAPAPEGEQAPDIEPNAPDATEPVPSFVRQAQRQAFWQSRGVRAGLSLLSLLLIAVLISQWAFRERDRLAAWQPGLQPLLQRMCDPLGCAVAPVRRIEAIVIDSTSLVRRLGDFYSFDLVLKNTASMALAVPALELSLTDIGDDVIARRVFLPEEWPDAPALLPAQGSVSVRFRLSLALGDATPMAGYRALVFYP
jgi:predicted Zn finger-like uncharacterized protein